MTSCQTRMMMRVMKIASVFILSLFLVFSTGLAEHNSGTNDSVVSGDENKNNNIFVVCSRQKEMRWLRAFKLENGRCKTYYSKEGYVQVVSAASYFSSCSAVLETVKKNIEEGGFKCLEKNLTSMIELE
jgi:hypothetical protein